MIIMMMGVALPLVFIDTIISTTTGKKTMGSPPRRHGEEKGGALSLSISKQHYSPLARPTKVTRKVLQ